MTLLISFALALFLTTVTLPLCLRYAGLLGLLDAPGAARKVHETVTPRSGGLAIVIGSLGAAVVWMPDLLRFAPLFAAVGLIIAFGFLDDRYELSSGVKCFGQLLAAATLLVAYGGFPSAPFFALDATPLWLALAWTLVLLVGVTNAVNLSDGLDGLAAGNTLLSLCLLAVLAVELGERGLLVLALAMGGGLLGFLRFNTHPARLFMGDTGSQFLGFTAGALTVLLLQHPQAPFSPLLPLLIFGLPALDTLAVMAVRRYRGQPMFQADRNHLHHQLLNLGFRHFEVVGILYLVQGLVVLAAYLLRYASDLTVLLAFGVFAGLVGGPILAARLAGWRVRAPAVETCFVERRNLWLRQFEWYYLHSAKVLAGSVALLFLGSVAVAQPGADTVGTVALGSAAVLGVGWIGLRAYPAFAARLASFTAVAFALYGFATEIAPHSTVNVAIDVFLLTLAALLVLAIRMTRNDVFHLDTQDYLVLFIVAVVPFLPLQDFDNLLVARVVLRLVVLLYVCEYVVSRGRGARALLTAVSIGSLTVLGFTR
jgi:UDP-GlcNAc:undecaprenyl-phosphate GlcNAc-1-phosphate transferase